MKHLLNKYIKQSSKKVKISFVLFAAMLIVVLSYCVAIYDLKKTNDDINTIYYDRLVVARYIFKYTNELHSIKSHALSGTNDTEKEHAISHSLKRIKEIDTRYLKTVLTAEEKTCLTAFLALNSATLKMSKSNDWSKVESLSNEGLLLLDKLSDIQVSEGQSKLSYSNSIQGGNYILGHLQAILLIILGSTILYLFTLKKNKKKIVKIPPSPSLN